MTFSFAAMTYEHPISSISSRLIRANIARSATTTVSSGAHSFMHFPSTGRSVFPSNVFPGNTSYHSGYPSGVTASANTTCVSLILLSLL